MIRTSQWIAEKAVDRTAYSAGRGAFASGCVCDYDARPIPKTGGVQITASVKSGGVFYDVTLVQDAQGELQSYECDCPVFYSRDGACAHVVAVLFAHMERCGQQERTQTEDPAVVPMETDVYAGAMLHRYGEAAGDEPMTPAVPLKLIPALQLPTQGEAPTAGAALPPAPRLEMRYAKGGPVRDIPQFCEALAAGSVVDLPGYGKVSLTPEAFAPRSRELALLVAAKQAERTAMAVYQVFDRERKSLRLTPNAMDRLFALYRGTEMTLYAGGTESRVTLVDGNPPIALRVQAQPLQKGFRFELEQPLRCLCGERVLYVWWGSLLYRCEEEYSERLRAFLTALDSAAGVLTVSARDLPSFCSVVLPRLHGLIELRGDLNDLAAYRPEPFTLEIYLDLPAGDVISAEPQCVYGERRVNLLSPVTDDGPRRDPVREKQLLRRLEHWFSKRPTDTERLYARGDEAVYRLLTEGFSALGQHAALFVTSRLRELRVMPMPKVSMQVRFSGSVLELNCSTDGFSPAELAQALGAYRMNRKFYRLRNGQFLDLDAPVMQELAELADGLGVEDDALGQVFSVPQYRALFLEAQTRNDRALQFDRDAYFTRLVQQIGEPSSMPFVLPTSLHGQLRGYQETGVRWLAAMEKYGFGGILADDMGLGKTVQMISLFLNYAEHVPDAARLPALVVCPTSLVLNWVAELRKFAPSLNVMAVIGSALERDELLDSLQDCHVVITSYELLRRDSERYEQQKFRYIVLDEAQYIKNFNTRSAHAVKQLHAERRFALTGTPIENRLSELWSIFDFLMPGYLYDYARFKNLFELPTMRENDSGAAERLHRMVAPFILRRLKRDVLAELPPKTETIRSVRMNEEQRKLYVATALAGRDQLIGQNGNAIQILALLTRLRQICCDPALCCEGYDGESAKLESCMELLREATGSGHKVLLFSQFTSMLTRIEQRLQAEQISCFLLRGSTPKEKRADMVERFNCDDTPVFLCSLKAGGTGLNLTGADVVVHYDPWWNLAAQNQATDRAHRIGQRSRVQVYKLIAEDSIEERILALQARKQSLADAIVQDGDAALLSLSREELLELVCAL